MLFRGDPIPYIEYTKEETATWGAVWEKVFELLPGRACSIHRVRLEKMMQECGTGPNCIPQMEDVSNFLKRKKYEFLDNILEKHFNVLIM